MILTQEFLDSANACEEGKQLAISNNYIGEDYFSVTKDLIAKGNNDFAGWMVQQKQTELYVRSNGKVFTMGTYQVFNPITGQYTACADETSVREAALVISQQILATYPIVVNQTITNENGDSAWTASSLASPIVVS